jgi:uncharacterized protein (DUF58 family)
MGWTDDLRHRARAWALRRQGPDRLPLTLRARRLYILPTRAGVAFGGLLAVGFIAGLNYGSGLAMLLTFWLTGFALAAMLRTHRSMAGMRLLTARAEPTFAGLPVPAHLQFDAAVPTRELSASIAGGGLQVEAEGTANDGGLALGFPPAPRGPWTMPAINLATRAPFGLFRTWTWLALPLGVDVYPKPGGGRPLPEAPGSASGRAAGSTGLDELTWLRPFREGDSPRQVAWKAYAREAPLLVREYRGNTQLAREFDFDALPGLPVEQRLSQLCEWVLVSSSRGERYRLRLPGGVDLDGSGAAHREACLTALARFDSGSSA